MWCCGWRSASLPKKWRRRSSRSSNLPAAACGGALTCRNRGQISNRKLKIAELQNDDASNLQFAFSILNLQFPPLQSPPPWPLLTKGGDTNPVGWNDAGRGVRTHGFSSPDGSAHPGAAPSSDALTEAAPARSALDPIQTDREPLFSAACGPNLPRLHQEDSPGVQPFPPLRKGGPGGVHSDTADTSNPDFATPPPVDYAATPADENARGLADAIDDHGRHFEQVLSDLEQSLSRLFTTQIEILNHLGDTARQHERRWQEQSTTRRATYAV